MVILCTIWNIMSLDWKLCNGVVKIEKIDLRFWSGILEWVSKKNLIRHSFSINWNILFPSSLSSQKGIFKIQNRILGHKQKKEKKGKYSLN